MCVSVCLCVNRDVMYLEAVLELFADKVEDDGVYTGVDRGKVDAEVIQDQQETERNNRDWDPLIQTWIKPSPRLKTFLIEIFIVFSLILGLG